MSSPHPILDGAVRLSPQISLEYEPGGFEVRGHRDAVRKFERTLYLVYRHRDHFRFSPSYRSFISIRGGVLSFWRGRKNAVSIEGAAITIVKPVRSNQFGRYAVVAHRGSDELPLVDEIKSARDAEHIAQALTEFLRLSEEDADASAEGNTKGLPEPPPDTWTLQVRRAGSALHIANKWRNYLGVYWLTIATLVASIVPWALAESFPRLSVSLVLGWSAVVIYISFALLLNRSDTYIDRSGLLVHNHPLPWRSAPKVALDEIHQFECEPAPVPSWNPPYAVRVGTTHAGTVTIARNLKEPHARALHSFLRSEVRRIRNAPGAQVRVEAGLPELTSSSDEERKGEASN